MFLKAFKMKYKFLKTEDVKEILELYPNHKAEFIAEKFCVPISKIYKTAARYKVKKSPEFLSSTDSGRIQKGQHLSPETRFKKGDKSATKAKRMEALIKNEEKLKNWRNKLWKKGHKPINTAKDGDVRWREGLGYYFIRISDNKWVLYHRYLWEEKYGKIEEGFNIVFKDGNSKNCNISNLECLSNEEIMLKNSIQRYPKELVQVMQLNGKLKRQINKSSNNG